ncbi:MAG: hypothetical protein NUV49_01220 [Patescibacteria group bacterium]|nr:hypothetical protein [Patescibacteria group bacterium]
MRFLWRDKSAESDGKAMKRKDRVLILASPNGTLTATYASSFSRLPSFKQQWQVLFHFKAINAMQYVKYAQKCAVEIYGL